MAESQNVGTLKVNFEIDYTDAAKFIKSLSDNLGALKMDFDEVGKAMDNLAEREVPTTNRTPTVTSMPVTRTATPSPQPAVDPLAGVDLVSKTVRQLLDLSEELQIADVTRRSRGSRGDIANIEGREVKKSELIEHIKESVSERVIHPQVEHEGRVTSAQQSTPISPMPPFTVAPSTSITTGAAPPTSAPSPTGQPITMTGAVTITIQTGDLNFPVTDELKTAIINGIKGDLQNPMSEANKKLGRLIASVAHGVGGIS